MTKNFSEVEYEVDNFGVPPKNPREIRKYDPLNPTRPSRLKSFHPNAPRGWEEVKESQTASQLRITGLNGAEPKLVALEIIDHTMSMLISAYEGVYEARRQQYRLSAESFVMHVVVSLRRKPSGVRIVI